MDFRVPIRQAFADFFDYKRGKTLAGIARFIAAGLSFSVFANTLSGLSGATSQCVLYVFGASSLADPKSTFLLSLGEMLLPTLGLAAVTVWILLNYNRNRKSAPLTLDSPTPHEGLILMLGPFTPRKGCSIANHDDLLNRLNSTPSGELREQLLHSNWGTLVVAVEHHAPALKGCWILVTQSGSVEQFDTAKMTLARFCRSETAFESALVENAHDLTCTLQVVERIYKDAGIKPERIIADFTGGTAAMSAGMVLATLDNNRPVEYLRQDIPIIQPDRAFTCAEILAAKALVSIHTTPGLVERHVSDENLTQSHAA